MTAPTPITGYVPLSCQACLDGAGLDFNFSMAFQPIVNIRTRSIFAYEALVRGINNEPAREILSRVSPENVYRFDQACRVKTIALAARLNPTARVSINFLPRAIYNPDTCIRTTLAAARKYNFPLENLIFEVTEVERADDHQHLVNIFQAYKRYGFCTAIDDFGTGYAGLDLLARFQPDLIKVSRELLSGLHADPVKQAIVGGIADTCRKLGIKVIAEGVEEREELITLARLGIDLYQGYYFARPAFETMASVPETLFDL